MVKFRIDNETKEAKFRRIAGNRVNNILNQLSILKNCANTRTYSYNNDQINKIFKAIEEELKVAKMAFLANKNRNREIRL